MVNSVTPGKDNGSLWILLGILGVIAAGYFYTWPQLTELKSVRTTAAARTADLEAIQAQQQEISVLAQQLASRAADLDRLTLAVPSTSRNEELLVSLEHMASTSGVVLSTVQPTATAASSGSEVTVTLRGSYSGVAAFIELLDKNLRPVKIVDLSLTGSSDVVGASLVDATMTVVAADATPRAAAGSRAVGEDANE